MKKIICVLGMHRSGTSLLSNIINKLGVFWGNENELMKKNDANPDGYFELSHIITMQDKILDLCGTSWNSCKWIEDDMYHKSEIQIYTKHLKRYLNTIYTKNNIEYFGFKDPRTCLLLPIWKKIFIELNITPIYIWIIRNPEEVSNSLYKRNNYRREYAYHLWSYYNLKILYDLQGERGHIIYYNELLNNTENICRELNKYIFENENFFRWECIKNIVNENYRHSKEEDIVFSNFEIVNKIYFFIKKLYNKNKFMIEFPVNEQIKNLKNIYLKKYLDIRYESNWALQNQKQYLLIKCYRNYNNILSRLSEDTNIINNIYDYLKKNNYKSIVLYGLGTLGKILFAFLRKEGIVINLIIDENLSKQIDSYKGIPIYCLNKVSINSKMLVVVTPNTEYVYIQYVLKNYGIVNNICSIEELLDGCKYDWDV